MSDSIEYTWSRKPLGGIGGYYTQCGWLQHTRKLLVNDEDISTSKWLWVLCALMFMVGLAGW